MDKLSLRGFFVCNKCRSNCFDGKDEIGPFGPNECPKEYFPRKQEIGCLGQLCDNPCELQVPESDVSTQQYINLIMYLGKQLNELIITEK